MTNRTKIFIDLEMNPVDGRRFPHAKQHLRREVIEIGAIVVNEQYLSVRRWSAKVKPSYNSSIMNSITDLTGIRMSDLSGARTLAEAMCDLYAWIAQPLKNVVFIAWSKADERQLKKEFAFKNYDLPLPRIIDLQASPIKGLLTFFTVEKGIFSNLTIISFTIDRITCVCSSIILKGISN